jgi:hypothetical protein
VTSVAAPVLNNRRVIAALSVVTQSGNLQPAALIPAVVAVARAISRALSVVAQSGNLQPAALTPAVVAVARAISRAVSVVSAGLPMPAATVICRSSRKRPM